MPPFARRSKSLKLLIPMLYLKGISTGDFEEVLDRFARKGRRWSLGLHHRQARGRLGDGSMCLEPRYRGCAI